MGLTREKRGRVTLDMELRPRSNARPICSGCSRSRPAYDTLAPRCFEFVPLWGIAVSFVYAMRRVDCPRCGVVVESVPWSSGKHQTTATYAWFLASARQAFHASANGSKAPMGPPVGEVEWDSTGVRRPD